MDSANRGLDLEKELTCSICTEVLFQPLTLLDCLHTFCGACLKEWFGWQVTAARNNPSSMPSGLTPYTCPSCRATVRDTKHNATVTTLLDMFLAANPDKGKTAEEKEDLAEKYTPGEEVMPKTEQKEMSLRERRREDEDRRLIDEVRGLSLQEVGVAPSEGRTARRRRDEERLGITASQSSRESRSAEDREHRRRTEGGDARERRRRHNGPTSSVPNQGHTEEHRRRRSQEDTRRRREQTTRTAVRTIEHQASLRSLISNSDVDSREMEEEILRQIQEEGLLDGIDLDNIDLAQEDQISERIAEAFRRRQREISRNTVRSVDASPATRSVQSEPRNTSDTEGLRPSSRHLTHSRTTSATSQAEELTVSAPRTSSSRLEIQPGNETRRRRRTTSGNRSATSPVPGANTDRARPATRSQTDLSDRPHSSHNQSSRPQVTAQSRSTTEPTPQSNTAAPVQVSATEELQRGPNPTVAARATVEEQSTVAVTQPPPSISDSTPSTSIFVPASKPSSTTPHFQDRSLLPDPLSTRHIRSTSATERATLFHSAARPTSSSSSGSRVSMQRFTEPSLTCARCAKPHIEYDLHYNCSQCQNGDWNICLPCYRAGRGCLYWFGFGYAAWAKWEKMNSSGEAYVERPHMLFANRYIAPKVVPGGADGRRTITSEDPQKRLQGGAFCANCFAWANECYWRCDFCNEGDWGFCNNCVNQGKCCTHPLLPLLYKPDQNTTPPLSPTHAQQTPPSATLLTGPGVVEYGSFKPLTFRVSCDICRHPIQPSSTRYHCSSCTSSIPGSQPGDYDICTNCYHSLVVKKKRISPENGHNGWRRCPQGHRMIIVGFEDRGGGQRRVIAEDLVGGHSLYEEPYKSLDHAGQDLQLWSWAEGTQIRLVTMNLSAAAPTTSTTLSLTTNFPPVGGLGMKTVALWSWYPQEEGGENELLFPKGADVRECVDVNSDWFHGVYMGTKGLFPAPYVKNLDKGPGF